MTSASEKAYVTIRDLIARGDLRPGDLLIAEDLANHCGVSRTPVREAILRLQAELFAVRLDNKRTVVRSWSTDEIDDFIELRLRLAGYAAARAAGRVTDDQIAELWAINARMTALLSHEDHSAAFSLVAGEFYNLITEIAASERLHQISRHILDPSPLLRSLEDYLAQTDAEMASDHRDLILALEARDPVWAEASMTAHIRKSYRPKTLRKS
jgi:DNA-binding GntR family transcriptional regulator